MEPLQLAPTPPFARLKVSSTPEDGKPEEVVAVGVRDGRLVAVGVRVNVGVGVGCKTVKFASDRSVTEPTPVS